MSPGVRQECRPLDRAGEGLPKTFGLYRELLIRVRRRRVGVEFTGKVGPNLGGRRDRIELRSCYHDLSRRLEDRGCDSCPIGLDDRLVDQDGSALAVAVRYGKKLAYLALVQRAETNWSQSLGECHWVTVGKPAHDDWPPQQEATVLAQARLRLRGFLEAGEQRQHHQHGRGLFRHRPIRPASLSALWTSNERACQPDEEQVVAEVPVTLPPR